MNITKILEGTLAAGQTTISFTDTDLPLSLIRIYSTKDGLYPMQSVLSGNTLTITYEAQGSSTGIAVEMVKAPTVIYDGIDSTDTDKALSANQGKVLSDMISGITPLTSLTELDDVSISSPAAGDILTYDSINETWDNVPMPSIPSDISDLDDVNISSIQDGQILAWDDDSDKFVNINPASSSFPYIDGANEIYNSGTITSGFSSYSYTPTADCWIVVTTKGTGATSIVYLNGGIMCGNAASTEVTFSPFLIKAGDTITLRDLTGAVYVIRAYKTR